MKAVFAFRDPATGEWGEPVEAREVRFEAPGAPGGDPLPPPFEGELRFETFAPPITAAAPRRNGRIKALTTAGTIGKAFCD